MSFATMLSWELSESHWSDLFLLPGDFSVSDMVFSDWSIAVSKASWHCIILSGQLVLFLHFILHCPMSCMMSDFFFAFILVELRNKWIVAFWIVLCPFSAQKCQCSAVIPTSVLWKECGLWNVCRVFRI